MRRKQHALTPPPPLSFLSSFVPLKKTTGYRRSTISTVSASLQNQHQANEFFDHWTPAEDNLFEHSLAQFESSVPLSINAHAMNDLSPQNALGAGNQINIWGQISQMTKTPDGIRKRYNQLVDDIRAIESGRASAVQPRRRELRRYDESVVGKRVSRRAVWRDDERTEQLGWEFE